MPSWTPFAPATSRSSSRPRLPRGAAAHAQDRKVQKKEEKERQETAAPVGGNLMAALAQRLSMRRKGISGKVGAAGLVA